MQERVDSKLADIEGPSAPPPESDPHAPTAPVQGPVASASAAPPAGKLENVEPSAPLAAATAPVVETYKSTECVVCMENKVRILHLSSFNVEPT